MRTPLAAFFNIPSKEPEPIAAVDLASEGPMVIPHRRGFFYRRDDGRRSIDLALTSRGTRDLTVIRQLLAGCVLSARPDRQVPGLNRTEPVLLDYIFQLCGAYQMTQATPPTLRQARDRFHSLGDWRTADYAEQKAVEETGHIEELAKFITGLESTKQLQVCRAIHRSAAIMFHETDQGKEKAALQALLEKWGWQPFVTIATGPHAAERGMACA